MWRALVVATVLLSSVLPQSDAFSFISQVFFRLLFPKPPPLPEPQVATLPLVHHGRSKSMKEQVDEEMATGHTPEKMLENLVLTLISTSREIVPDDFVLTDNTYDLPVTGKVHFRKGKVSGVRSYGEPKLQSSFDREGNVIFTVELHFTNLVATFNSIYLDFYGNFFDKQGRGTFKFKKNKFLLKLRVVKKEKIFERMTKNDCVVFVRSVEVAEISDVDVDIYNDKDRRAFYTSAIVDVAIVSLEKMLQEQLTLAIGKWMWDLLPEKNAFTCRDTKLHDMIELIAEEQERHKLEEGPSGDSTVNRPTEQPSQPSSQPKTGVIGSVMNWWKGKPEDKKEGEDKKPGKTMAEGGSPSGSQQQGWFWNRWYNNPPPKPKEPEIKLNVPPDSNNNNVENTPKEEKTVPIFIESGPDTKDIKIPSTVISKPSAQNS